MPDERGLPVRRPRYAPRASGKILRGYAISACQQFAVSYAHIVGCLRDDGLRRFILDLQTGRIVPRRYDTWRNRCLTDRVSHNFRDLLERFAHIVFHRVRLTCDVYRAPDGLLIETRVTLVASDGRRWQGGIREVGPRIRDRFVIPRGDAHRPAIARRTGCSLRSSPPGPGLP